MFTGLSPEALAPALEGALVKAFSRQAVLFLQGEPANRFFVILDGWVRLYRQTTQGREVTIAVFGRGSTFAEAVHPQIMPFPCSAQVIVDSRLLVVPARGLIGRLCASNDLCLRVMASMSLRLDDLILQLENFSSRTTVQRTALFILHQCNGKTGSNRIELPLDKHLIAAQLGMQPETFSRCLAKLRRAGIEADGHRLLVQDVSRLRRVAEHGAIR